MNSEVQALENNSARKRIPNSPHLYIMSVPSDNENWIIDTGDLIIQKESECGSQSLTPWERLVYCLWVADYGMRNAGDLETANDLHPKFQTEAAEMASELALKFTAESFSLPQSDLQQQYFERFDRICQEIKPLGHIA